MNPKFPAILGSVEWSLLDSTAFSGIPEIISLALQPGVNSSKLTNDGKTALDIACDTGNWAVSTVPVGAADEQQELQSFYYPSKFHNLLENPFREYVWNFSPS